MVLLASEQGLSTWAAADGNYHHLASANNHRDISNTNCKQHIIQNIFHQSQYFNDDLQKFNHDNVPHVYLLLYVHNKHV